MQRHLPGPYTAHHIGKWRHVTQQLLDQHPIKEQQWLKHVEGAWKAITDSRIDGRSLFEYTSPGSMIGTLFERILSLHLEREYAGLWRGCRNVYIEKDLVFVPNQDFSVEVKVSGQKGFKILGNKSYSTTTMQHGKSKNSYYLTVNYLHDKLTLVRFGWIDQSDWMSHKSMSSRATTPTPETYLHKLKVVKGDYMLHAPIECLLPPQKVLYYRKSGVTQVQDLLLSSKILDSRDREVAKNYLRSEYYLNENQFCLDEKIQ